MLRHQNRYYEYLQVVRKEGDWEGWLAFFLDGVIEVGEQVTQTIAAVLRMLDEQRTRIIDGLGRAVTNGQRVLVRLIEHPIVDVATVREWLTLTPARANQFVAKLEHIGVPREISGYAGSRRFRFDPYVRFIEKGSQNECGSERNIKRTGPTAERRAVRAFHNLIHCVIMRNR